MKNILRFLLGFISMVVALAYVLSCFTHLISPEFFSPLALLALGFPYLAGLLLLLIIIWFFVNGTKAVGLILILLVGYNNLFTTFAVNLWPNQTSTTKTAETLKVLSWNVNSFTDNLIIGDSVNSIRRQMLSFIKSSDADVLCLQEFVENDGEAFVRNISEFQKIGYPFYYFSRDFLKQPWYSNIYYGSVIFSKFPITDSGKTMLGDPSHPENIIYADIQFENKPVRIFSTHFKSMNLFNKPSADTFSITPFHYDTGFFNRTGKIEKLKIFGREHVIQAGIAKSKMNSSPYPVIFTGDLNSTPASYAYYLMSNGLKDAFLRKSFGLGGTMVNLPKTLRIDYIFADKVFEVKSFKKYTTQLSDHYPVTAEFNWQSIN